jgi:alcohol dehydrogenase class IV
MGIVPADAPDEEAVSELVRSLHRLNRELKVPTPAEFGIDSRAWEESIPSMVQQALVSGSPSNNPRVPSADEIEQIYRDVWTAGSGRSWDRSGCSGVSEVALRPTARAST